MRFRTHGRSIRAVEVDQPNKFYYNPGALFYAYFYH